MLFKSILRFLLWPIGSLYGLIGNIRNWLYDNHLMVSYQSSLTTIGVGNLTIGGTGKTPHIEYLIRFFKNKNVAVLSRGYGRKTSGFLAIDSNHTAAEVGDEPLQLYQKFIPAINVFVCEKRAKGLKMIENKYQSIQTVLLDDAFQHRAVTPHLQLLLTDFGRLFTDDFVLPQGLLRENKKAAQRADAIIVTKCPNDLSEKQQISIENKLKIYSKPNTPIFFSSFEYQTPTNDGIKSEPFNKKKGCWLVSGIAQPKHFEQIAKANFDIVGHTYFRDHHSFTTTDIENIVKQAEDNQLLMTEKDWVKIKPLLPNNIAAYYWPIEVRFLTNGFDEWLNDKATSFRSR